MVLCTIPTVCAAEAAGQISGVALLSSGDHFAGQVVRLRGLDLGQVAGITTTTGAGRFQFVGVKAGSYIVELVSNGSVVGTSVPVTLTPKTMTAEGVTATAAVAAATQAPVGNSGGSFWTSTFGIITMAAVAAGITTAFMVTQDDASPKR
jgi:hypothetical protein